MTNRFNENLKKACETVGIPYYSSHKIRFGVVTAMYDAVISENIIQSWAGHSDIATKSTMIGVAGRSNSPRNRCKRCSDNFEPILTQLEAQKKCPDKQYYQGKNKERVMGIERFQAPENAYRKGLCGIGNLLVDPWSTHQKSKMSTSALKKCKAFHFENISKK